MSKILRNQIITSEGIQSYFEQGREVKKLKTWENLKKFLGMKIPVTDGHPISKLIDGDTKTFGTATIKQCPKGKNTLCADIELDDDAPDRKGYSVGYPFRETDEGGIHNGQQFDREQKIATMDHLALTDYNRHPYAVKVSGDAKNEVFTKTLLRALLPTDPSNIDVVKYSICLDSFSAFSNNQEAPDQHSLLPSEEDKTNHSSGGSTTFETRDVENTMPDDLKQAMADNAKLKEELATLKAEKTANDSFSKQLSDLQVQMDSMKSEHDKEVKEKDQKIKEQGDSLKAKEEVLHKIRQEEITKTLSTLKKGCVKKGIDAKKMEEILAGKDEKAITAMNDLYLAFDSLPQSNVTITSDDSDHEDHAGGDSEKEPSTLDYYYDPKTKRMEPLKKK